MRHVPPPHGAALVKLTGRRRGVYALVDAVDYDAVVAAGPWHLYTPSKSAGKRRRRTRYARKVFYSAGSKVSKYLHRWLWERWGMPPAEHVDHRDGDGLDCRRHMLRAATHAQNQRARSYKNRLGLKGIKLVGNRFVARITVDGVRRSLGRFDTATDAAAAYDRAARELHGEFAQVNYAAAC